MKLVSGFPNGVAPSALRFSAKQLEQFVSLMVSRMRLALGRWEGCQGISQSRVCQRVGVAPQTVGDWSRRRDAGQLNAVPRGWPVHVLSVTVKHNVQDLLCECHGRLGLPMLKHTFQDVPRAQLADLRRS